MPVHAAKPSVPRAKRSIVELMRNGIFPACRDVTEVPTAVVVHGHNVTTGAPEVRCRTGAGDNDSTSVIAARCTDSAVWLYFWGSRTAAHADQHLYAGRSDGKVIVVPGVHGADLALASTLPSVRRALGC